MIVGVKVWADRGMGFTVGGISLISGVANGGDGIQLLIAFQRKHLAA
jgi:hypothetical protein